MLAYEKPISISNVRYLDTTMDKKILVVEDDLCLKPIMSRIIGAVDPDISYAWVTNVEEAEEYLKNHQVHLIVSDYFLPGNGTGMTLWQDCLKRHAKTPFILMTNLDVERFVKMVDQDTVVPAFLSKPFRPSECCDMIESLLFGRKV